MRYVSLFCGLVFVGNACGGKSSEAPSAPAGGDAGQAAKGGSSGEVGHAGGRGGASGGGRGGHGAGRAGSGGGKGGAVAGAGGEPDGAAGESSQTGAGDSAVGARGGSGGGSGAAGAGGDAPEPHTGKLADGVCPDAAVWSPGVEQCGQESFIHRVQALGCPLPARDPDDLPPEAGHDEDDDVELEAYCYTDEDCGVGAYCVRRDDYSDFHPVQECITPCGSDADCGVMEACLCQPELRNASRQGAHFGACRPATCVKDEDCGAGTFCRAPLSPELCLGDWRGPTRLSCQMPADECSGGDECPPPQYSDQLADCLASGAGPMVCGVRNEC